MELSPPGLPTTVHICVYLPTAGKEGKFVDNLAQFSLAVESIKEENPGVLLYFCGDFNVSNSKSRRLALLQRFCSNLELKEVIIQHPTYHHFLGFGESD